MATKPAEQPPERPPEPGAQAKSPAATTPASPPALSPSQVVAPPSEEITPLSSSKAIFSFTSIGGALKTVKLLDHREQGSGNLILNQLSSEAMMAVRGWGDSLSFQRQEQTSDSIIYSTDLANGLHWERHYQLVGPYTVHLEDHLINTSSHPISFPEYGLALGQSEPLHIGEHHQQMADQYLGAAFYSNKMVLMTLGDLNPSSFFWIFPIHAASAQIRARTKDPSVPIIWAATQNQFFTHLLTPRNGLTIGDVAMDCFNNRDESGYLLPHQDPQLETEVVFGGQTVAAGQNLSLVYDLYTGPKDYDQLAKLGETQSALMNYGWFVILIYPMLWLLRFYHGVVAAVLGSNWAWGWAIILLTTTVRVLVWPVQSSIYASARQMQALSPLMKEIQTKFKDDPTRLQKEMFALYGDYGIYPWQSCWTVFIQMPVFFSLYYMLQSAVDLRGASFLWAHDLSQPDTIFSLAYAPGKYLALNPLPVLVTCTMMIQMRLTPMTSPDPMQVRIAQLMPLVFMFIFYNFASALSLYYVINNSIIIVQIYRNKQRPLPVLKRRPSKARALA